MVIKDKKLKQWFYPGFTGEKGEEEEFIDEMIDKWEMITILGHEVQ
jgi:hypothetical protein